jgi:alpha-1,3-rhamnosyl/mannosyltransferase
MATIALDARKWTDFGIGTYVRCLVAELVKLESPHELMLLMHSDSLAQGVDLPREVRCVAVEARSYSLRELLLFGGVVRRAGADLYHAPHYPLPVRLPAPTVVTVHDLIHLLFPQFLPTGPRGLLARIYAQRMLRSSARRARRIITPSQSTADDLQSRLRVPAEKIRVIPNGVHASFARSQPEAEVARTLAELQVHQPFVLFVANPKPHKNFDRLLEAYALWQSAESSSQLALPRLVCVGARPPERQKLTDLFANDPNTQILGYVDDATLAHLYAACEMFVFPSLYEGFGLPVLEAMAAGAPVITSTTSSLPEVAGDAALLVDPHDATALAHAMQRLHADPDLRAELQRRGRRRAAAHSWATAAAATLAVYEEVLAEEAARR